MKKTEHWRIDAFELWCWKRLLRVTWTARRSNQSILKEISPEYSLEGLMLKLKLQLATWCKELTHWKRPDAGKDWRQKEKGDNRTWDDCMASPTRRTWVWASSGVGDRQGSLACCSPWGRRVGQDWVTKLNWSYIINFKQWQYKKLF